MAKKIDKVNKMKRTKLNGTKKGKVEKKEKSLKKQKKLAQNGKIKRNNGKSKRINQELDDSTSEIKKKPNKAELKSVIEELKKDSNLMLIRKALKYIPFYLKSEGLTKKLLKEVIRLWSEAGEKVRVVCLLCLIRIYTKLKESERKQQIIKQLYNSFLEKCRITKHETMSMIGFMRHSLVELYKLDQKIAFKQAQTSCQQLTVTLKNAYTHKNEETYKTVLNWQFANCLILLSSLIVAVEEDSPIKTLTHQVIQLNLGSLTIISSPRYYPFYCHLIDNLINLSTATNLFIPILPLMIGILDKIQIPKAIKIEKKNKKAREDQDDDEDDDVEDEDVEENDSDDEEASDDDSGKRSKSHEAKKVKQYNMDLLNHVSLEEAHCLEYSSAVVDKIYELMLRYLASQCHRIAFPELVLLPNVQMKKWIKKNPTQQQTLKFKTLLDKIKIDCNRLEEARRSVDFAFTNYSAVDAWEKKMRDSNKLVLPKLVEKLETAEA